MGEQDAVNNSLLVAANRARAMVASMLVCRLLKDEATSVPFALFAPGLSCLLFFVFASLQFYPFVSHGLCYGVLKTRLAISKL